MQQTFLVCLAVGHSPKIIKLSISLEQYLWLIYFLGVPI